MSTDHLTLDRFLDARITVAQPLRGFRAGHESVLLAAAVPAQPNATVLELGAGAGVASLCLAARVPDVRIAGIEIDPDLVCLANENAARNSFADRVKFIMGDASATTHFPPPFTGDRGPISDSGAVAGPSSRSDARANFDHVFFNPPFHPDSAHISPMAARDRATRDSSDVVRTWTKNALSLVRDGGTVIAITRTDRVDDIVNAASGHDAIVLPLFPRVGEPAKRTIVRISKTPVVLPPSLVEDRGPICGSGAVAGPSGRAAKRPCGRKGGELHDSSRVITAPGLVLHEADGHPTPAAEAVLRHAQALSLA